MTVKALNSTFFLIQDKEELNSFWEKGKKMLQDISRIASAVDWNIHYAIYKPSPPTVEEIEWFKKQVDDLKRKIEILKYKFPFIDYQTLNSLEMRLARIEEEFENYPFSDRKFFFAQRLKFFEKLLKDIIYSCNEQSS